MQVQKFGGPPPQNWGPKACKIWANFTQLQTLIANISGTGQDIQNRKAKWSGAIPPAFCEKVRWGPLATEYYVWVWTHANGIFRQTIFRPLRGAGPSNLYMH